MSLRFWGNSKAVTGGVDLAWFENSVHGGVVILGIFRDAIAMSPSLYVKQIAEKTLSIIRAIAIAVIGDTGSLRISLQKLGEATAAVTATILQSYLESENRDGWPGSELQGIIEELIKNLNTIEVWVSSGQARNTMGRRKCVKAVKEFQERLSEVLEQFELASLLRSYTVFPFIKKMIEDYALGLDAGAAKWSMNADDSPKAPPGSGVVEEDSLNLVAKQQKYRMEKETHDALKVKVRLILRIIEKEERNQHTSRDKSAPANEIEKGLDQNPRELEKERQLSQRDEAQDSRGKLVPEGDKMGGDHDIMEQDAVEMLYDILMARLSNVAIPGPKLLSPTLEQPTFSLPSPLPPSYTANTPSQSTPSDRLSLEKSLPSLELVDTPRSQQYGYTPQAREAEHPYGQSKPFNLAKKGIKSRGFASLPPGAMPPIVGTVSLLSILTSTDSRSLTPVSIRTERSLSVTPLPDIEEEVEKGETLDSSADEESKPMASPLSLGVQEYMQSSRPSISADLNQEDRPTNAGQRALDVTLPMPTSYDDIGKDKPFVPLNATSAHASPGSIPFLPASTGPGVIKMPNGSPQVLDATRFRNALPGSMPFFPSTGPNKMPIGSPPLPPGAMPPKFNSWLPPPFGKEEPVPQGHRLAGSGPTLNPIPQSESSNANQKLSPSIQSNSTASRQPGLTLNDSSLLPTNSGLENRAEPNYHLPPITMPSPLTLAPLVVDSRSPNSPLLPPLPPVKRPEHIGPGENLRKMSPHMQRYIERLADRIWGGSEGGR